MLRGAARIAAATLLLVANFAQASTPGCEVIEALAQPGTKSLRGLELEVGSDGLIDVRYRGKATPLHDATGCEMGGPEDLFEVMCRWETGDDPKASQAIHARIKPAIERCLPAGLVAKPYKSRVEGLEVSESFEGAIWRADVEAVEVSLAIHSYTNANENNPDYAVLLYISR